MDQGGHIFLEGERDKQRRALFGSLGPLGATEQRTNKVFGPLQYVDASIAQSLVPSTQSDNVLETAGVVGLVLWGCFSDVEPTPMRLVASLQVDTRDACIIVQ